MQTMIGVGVMAGSALLFWIARPKGGKETWLARLPGSWILLPLLILMGFLAGGMMIYTQLRI
jgi:hypothetical protein